MKEKPTLNDLKSVINKWGGKNIPTVYLEGESWYEVLQILANKVYESLEWIEGYFNTDLEGIVEKTLNEWVDDGTIQVIISEALQWELDEYKVLVDKQFAQVENEVDVYVSPENFNSLNECIGYARVNKKIIKADYVKLEENANFRGVGLEINELQINGHSIVLGDYNRSKLPIIEGFRPYRPSQSIEIIWGRSGWDNEVFVRGACFQTIKIGQYSGNVQLLVNSDPDSNFIAYNEFYFRDVRGVKIRSEETVHDRSPDTGWVNENKFYLMNTRIFTLGNENGYSHNNNFIYGGCFESTGLIEIVSGNDNYFYDIRAELNLKIRFHELARRNRVFLSTNYYLTTVRDDSLRKTNMVINADERNMRIINQHSISTNNEIGANEGYNISVNSPFKNFRFYSDEKVFKQIPRDLGYGGHNIFYVSPFISDPSNIRVLLESHLKEGSLGIGWKFYDKDYVDITSDIAATNFSSYMVMTHKIHIDNPTNEGGYRGPSNYDQLRNNNEGTADNLFNVKDDIISLLASPAWGPGDGNQDLLDRVAYVKFFIGNTGEEASISFYDMTVTIYDMTNNYHKRYFGNQASSLEWTQIPG